MFRNNFNFRELDELFSLYSLKISMENVLRRLDVRTSAQVLHLEFKRSRFYRQIDEIIVSCRRKREFCQTSHGLQNGGVRIYHKTHDFEVLFSQDHFSLCAGFIFINLSRNQSHVKQ